MADQGRYSRSDNDRAPLKVGTHALFVNANCTCEPGGMSMIQVTPNGPYGKGVHPAVPVLLHELLDDPA